MYYNSPFSIQKKSTHNGYAASTSQSSWPHSRMPHHARCIPALIELAWRIKPLNTYLGLIKHPQKPFSLSANARCICISPCACSHYLRQIPSDTDPSPLTPTISRIDFLTFIRRCRTKPCKSLFACPCVHRDRLRSSISSCEIHTCTLTGRMHASAYLIALTMRVACQRGSQKQQKCSRSQMGLA